MKSRTYYAFTAELSALSTIFEQQCTHPEISTLWNFENFKKSWEICANSDSENPPWWIVQRLLSNGKLKRVQSWRNVTEFAICCQVSAGRRCSKVKCFPEPLSDISSCPVAKVQWYPWIWFGKMQLAKTWLKNLRKHAFVLSNNWIGQLGHVVVVSISTSHAGHFNSRQHFTNVHNGNLETPGINLCQTAYKSLVIQSHRVLLYPNLSSSTVYKWWDTGSLLHLFSCNFKKARIWTASKIDMSEWRELIFKLSKYLPLGALSLVQSTLGIHCVRRGVNMTFAF